MSDSPGLVDSVHHLPDVQVKFLGESVKEIQITEYCKRYLFFVLFFLGGEGGFSDIDFGASKSHLELARRFAFFVPGQCKYL